MMEPITFAPTGHEPSSVPAGIDPPYEGLPPLTVDTFYSAYRVDTTVPPEEVLKLLREAQAWVYRGLLNTYLTPEAVLTGIAGKEDDYQLAVYSRAKARQLEAWADFDTSEAGRQRGELLSPRIGSEYATAHHALARCQGQDSATMVSLV